MEQQLIYGGIRFHILYLLQREKKFKSNERVTVPRATDFQDQTPDGSGYAPLKDPARKGAKFLKSDFFDRAFGL
jgi:hypothetical protein